MSLFFHFFCQLPRELRLHIWCLALQQHRLIPIHLKLQEQQLAIYGDHAKAFTSNGERYSATVDGQRTCSKLLRVNRESRKEARSFYRVGFPCWLREVIDGKESMRSGRFFFNPEWDFLFINFSNEESANALADFIYHLKMTYDPQQIGLVNLALGPESIGETDLRWLEPSKLDPHLRIAFRDTLMQLREVFFVTTKKYVCQPLRSQGLDPYPSQFSRSLRIIATLPTFERIGRNLHPIARDAAIVSLRLWSPCYILVMWRHLVLEKFKLSPPHTQYRLLLALSPGYHGYSIVDKESTASWLVEDKTLFRNSSDPQQRSNPEISRNEDPSNTVRPVFGFWLFSEGAFREFAEEDGLSSLRRAGTRFDWGASNNGPELALIPLH